MTDPPPAPASTRSSPRAWLSLIPAVGGLILGVTALLVFVDVRGALAALTSADPRWIGLAVGLALNASVIVAVKLWAIVRMVDEPRSLVDAWSAVMAGVSLNAVVPGRGGDLVRAVFLARTREALPVLLGAVLVERLIDLFTLGLFVLLAHPVLDWITLIAAHIVVGAPLATTILALLGPHVPLRPDLGERVARTAGAIVRRPGLAAAAVGLSLLTWVNNAFMMVVCLWAVGVQAPFFESLRAAGVGMLAGALPLSISGIGTRDTALVLMLRDVADADAIAAGSFLFTVLMYWFLALVGSIALGRESLRTIRRAAAGGEPVQADAGGASDPEQGPTTPGSRSDEPGGGPRGV